MKQHLLPIAFACILLLPTVVRSEEKVQDVKVNPQSTLAGSEWIRFGPGIVDTVRSAELTRVRIVKNDMQIETYLVEGEKNVSKLKEWLIRNVVPLLKTRPLDEGIYASRPRLHLLLYANDKPDHDRAKYLMGVPLSVVFEDFSDKLFESLLSEWGAKRTE